MSQRRVIVIGSGPAGAMAAHELVRSGIPVIMLESGLATPSGWLLRIVDRNILRRMPGFERRVVMQESAAGGEPVWIRHLAPGGLSNQWTGAVPRFAPEDFFEGERLHERYRWPIGYQDLEVFYDKAERLIGVSGQSVDVPNLPHGHVTFPRRLPTDWLPIVRQAAANGQGLTPIPIADGKPTMLVRRGTAFNSYSVIVEPLLASPHFQLLTGAHALELEMSASDGHATGVVYHDRNDAQEKRLTADAVIVACGPLDSTRLLLNSKSAAHRDGVGNSAGLLGRHLHDHVRDWWACDLDRPISLLASAGYLTRRPFATSEPLVAASWTLGVADTRDRIRSRAALKSTALGVQVFGTTIPDDENFVSLAPSRRDAFGRPDLDVRMKFSERDVCNVLDARKTLTDLFDAAGFKASVRPAETRLTPGESVHYGGTARMHESKRYGVTDAWNRLYDVTNVLVCDASCFTTGPEKNPTLTVMAIAARAASRLADDLKKGGSLSTAGASR